MAVYSKKRIREFLDISNAESSNVEKGRALEDLACYLFGRIPGISISRRNVLNNFSSEEIDVAFWNKKAAKGLYFLEDIVLVECKNWSSPVGSLEVNWFDTKLKHRGLSFGILIAANGITGDPEERTAAHQCVAMALLERRRLVVVTADELSKLSCTDDLVLLLQEKLCGLAVSGTVLDFDGLAGN